MTSPIRALLAAGLLLVLGGCAKDTQMTPVPDCAGLRIVVFASDRNQAVGQFDLYLYDLDLLGFRLLASINSSAAADSTPTLSSDGRLIAFVSARNAPANTDILLYDRCRDEFLTRAKLATGFAEHQPSFSGDGQRLAFSRDTLGFRRVRMLDGPTDMLVPLVDLDGVGASFNDWDPAADLQGRRIAFVSDRNGNPDVFVYDVVGDSLLTLPDVISAARDLDPALTPDGRYLFFASDRADTTAGFNLYLFDLQTRALIPMPGLNTDSDERHPSPSTSGDAIAFQSNRGGANKMEIWQHVRSLQSTAQAPGQTSTADDLHPAMRWP